MKHSLARTFKWGGGEEHTLRSATGIDNWYTCIEFVVQLCSKRKCDIFFSFPSFVTISANLIFRHHWQNVTQTNSMLITREIIQTGCKKLHQHINPIQRNKWCGTCIKNALDPILLVSGWHQISFRGQSVNFNYPNWVNIVPHSCVVAWAFIVSHFLDHCQQLIVPKGCSTVIKNFN